MNALIFADAERQRFIEAGSGREPVDTIEEGS